MNLEQLAILVIDDTNVPSTPQRLTIIKQLISKVSTKELSRLYCRTGKWKYWRAYAGDWFFMSRIARNGKWRIV